MKVFTGIIKGECVEVTGAEGLPTCLHNYHGYCSHMDVPDLKCRSGYKCFLFETMSESLAAKNTGIERQTKTTERG